MNIKVNMVSVEEKKALSDDNGTYDPDGHIVIWEVNKDTPLFSTTAEDFSLREEITAFEKTIEEENTQLRFINEQAKVSMMGQLVKGMFVETDQYLLSQRALEVGVSSLLVSHELGLEKDPNDTIFEETNIFYIYVDLEEMQIRDITSGVISKERWEKFRKDMLAIKEIENKLLDVNSSDETIQEIISKIEGVGGKLIGKLNIEDVQNPDGSFDGEKLAELIKEQFEKNANDESDEPNPNTIH